jgi:ppGpp synthetase/RelA/SpoT-type nucleotidyltranferase
MNFDEYQKGGNALYKRLARAVRDILEAAATGRTDVSRVQAYQDREKGVESLKRKLTKRKMLDAPDIGDSIKDLAGVRVILYTNIDVDRYLQTRIIFDNLTVHWDETKAHYPSDENEGVRYEGIHYVVSLPDATTAQEQFAALKGLRCEIQVQTLLAHAFSESSHDIIYKGEDTPGFGRKIRKEMTERLNRVVDELLKPAGYELDKVQADFESLSRGIELFDRHELEAPDTCADNNERYDRLKNISDYLLPHYDEIGAMIGEVHRALLGIVTDARKSETKARTIEGVEIEGMDADDVMRLVIQIVTDLRYADVSSTLNVLITLYKSETDREIRQQIYDSAEKLASFNISVWKQVGPGVQLYLSDVLSGMTDAEIEQIRPLALTVWRCLLGSELDGTTWAADSVTIGKGALPASKDITDMRAASIKGLTGLLDRSQSDGQRRSIISALWEATQLPHSARYTNELLKTAITDMSSIAEILLPRLTAMNYDLWQHIESHLFREYHRFKPLADADKDDKGVRADAQKLVAAITDVRKRMNRSRNYVRYKTLVGYEGVFSWQWDQEDRDYAQTENFRKKRAARFVEQINEGNANRWLAFIRKCAATQSNDMATFPIFAEFLLLLGEKQPAVTVKAIESGNEHILNFLPALLTGLSKGAGDEYRRIVDGFVKEGRHLSAIARSLRFKDKITLEEAKPVLAAAIKAEDNIAVIECLAFAAFTWPTLGDDVIGELFLPALDWLTAKKDTRWVRGVWFLRYLGDFLRRLDAGQAKQVLDNLLPAERVDHQIEWLLSIIASRHVALVWAYFRDRLLLDENIEETDYQVVPFQFHGLQEVLARDPLAAINELRKWFKAGDNMFQFTGGRLLHSAFPECSRELSSAVREVCKAWTSEDVDFALHVLHNYRGEPAVHEVMKAVVRAIPEDDRRLSTVTILLENTGVVSGEYGMFDAMRERKVLMKEWLKDNDPKVRGFADRTIKQLDNRIAMERRDADMRKEKRKRDYE